MLLRQALRNLNLPLSLSPNPCSSVLSLSLSEAGHASVHICDLSGRLIYPVAEEVFPAEKNNLEWSAPAELSSGCCLVHLNSSGDSVTERLLLIN
ncbi:hypothetical protein CSA37_06145 [Candidatus Fermentibacteria bacterium]|nr:MAG: hypothetical protein CSA37_06145 [Candidatus Fermentibacteria bacterium]